KAAKPSRLRRIFRLGLEWTTAAMVATAVVAGAFLGLQALQRGAVADDGPAPRPPIPVAVLPIAIQPGYSIEERFTGRVEPARTAPVAFERAGLVLEVLADEGATVAADAPLARMDTEPLLLERRRLVAEREAVEADRALSALTEDRRRRLVDEGWTSGQSFDEARLGGTALEARRAALDAAIAALDLDIAKST
ncbi:MAG: efflux RND transporter periplasmic adaptor subunit, partial [Pseudomonadota bacterium]